MADTNAAIQAMLQAIRDKRVPEGEHVVTPSDYSPTYVGWVRHTGNLVELRDVFNIPREYPEAKSLVRGKDGAIDPEKLNGYGEAFYFVVFPQYVERWLPYWGREAAADG